MAILRAIGVISPAEADDAPAAVATRVAGKHKLSDPQWETLRCLAHAAADAIGAAHPAPDLPDPPDEGDAVARFRTRLLAAEAHLTAPALVRLSDEETAQVLRRLISLVLEAEAADLEDEASRALKASLGRWSRHRLRRLIGGVSPDELRAIDVPRWRAELRAQVATRVLDESGGDLRSALVTLIGLDAGGTLPELPENADLSSWIAASPQAHRLLARVESAWARGL